MKILVIVAHPDLAGSRANRIWAEAMEKQSGVTVHRLYEAYPEWRIDGERERELLQTHDRIILQFPLYWYSSPPLLKLWLDEVLSLGWAYGPGGDKLHGKELMLAVTTGGGADAYQPGGYNQYSLGELLRPFQATGNLTGMVYLPVFSVSAVYKKSDEELQRSAEEYIRHATHKEYLSPRIVRG